MRVEKQLLEPDMEQLTGSELGKEYDKAEYRHPAYLTFMHAEYIMWNAGLDESQAGTKIGRRNINNFRYADTTLMAKSEEELEPLEEGERREWKSWLETQH